MNNTSIENEDPLDHLLSLENQFYEEGKAEGEEYSGQVQYEKGLQFGKEQGRDVSLELGKMHGYCIVMKIFLNTILNDSQSHGDRVVDTVQKLQKTLEQIEVMLREFPQTHEELFGKNKIYERQQDDDLDMDSSIDVRQHLERVHSRFKMFTVKWNLLAKKMAQDRASQISDGKERSQVEVTSLKGSLGTSSSVLDF